MAGAEHYRTLGARRPNVGPRAFSYTPVTCFFRSIGRSIDPDDRVRLASERDGLSRILDSFPAGNQQQIRQQLSLALLAIVAQQLLPSADGARRHPVVEIMIGTPAVRSLIRKGEDHQLYSQISTGRADGMITMEQSLAEMARLGKITRETAYAHCFRPEDPRRYLDV